MKNVGMAIDSQSSFDDTKGVGILKEILEYYNILKHKEINALWGYKMPEE